MLRARFGTAVFALATLATVAGCSGGGATPDAGTDVPVAVDVRVDVPTDRPPPDAGAPLFAPCAAARDCGTGRMCLTDYPGGLCSRSCTSDTQCGDGGVCAGTTCRPVCSIGGGECGPGRACDTIDSADPTRLACYASCSTAPVAPEPACDMGLHCEPYVGLALCTASAAPTGADNGAACLSDDDCKGYCLEELYMGNPTGNVDGMCVSYGRVPSADLYGANLPLPQANCPAGNVLIPGPRGAGEGDWGICRPTCMAHTDCRPGYGCIHLRYNNTPTSNGYCAAINCNFADFAAMPNHHCPADFTCVMDMGATTGTCTRNAGASDGGVDGGGDASTDAGADTGGTDAGSGEAAADVGAMDASSDSAG
jgi:hypothetical protein